MRRYVPILIAGAALITAACSDSTAPTRSTSVSDLPKLSYFGGGPGSYQSYSSNHDEDNAKTVVFTIDPQGGAVRLNGFELVYPANAVCDPATSGYGPSEWKKSCETLNSAMTITAKVWVVDGRTHADFSPDIRFDPSKDVYVSVKMRDIRGQVPQADWADKYNIWYSTRVGDVRYFVNDAAYNPELATVFGMRDGKATGWMTRKIWHFSGYYVRSGRVCDEFDVCVDDPALLAQ